MIRLATDRLAVAAVTTVAGALIAVLGGMPEAAILAAPWAVLLVLGFANSGAKDLETDIELASDRVLVGDDVEVITTVTGAAGAVRIISLPGDGFWTTSEALANRPSARVCDVLVADRATVRCSMPAGEWGTHDVGRVQIDVTEPYGLFRWEGGAEQRLRVRVHPDPIELQNLLAPWLVRRIAGAHSSRATGRGIEYADIRPYSSGDSLRDINWRASARSPDLWVSQRHPDQATDVILLIDSFVESGHDVRTAVGLAIEAAVALAESHLAVTDRVGLVGIGGIVRWVSPGTGRIQLQRLTDALLSTGLYASVAERDLRVIPPRVLPPRSFVVALTPLLDDRFIDALYILGGRGHDVAVIECTSPTSTADSDEPESWVLARRMWEADRQVVRDRLAERRIAVASWRRGEHLDTTLVELTRRRQRTAQARRH